MLLVNSETHPMETDGVSCLECNESKVGSFGCMALELSDKSC